MNFFRQSTDQAREVFAAMPMQSRVITIMLVAAIAIGLGFLVRGGSTTNSEYLFGGRVLTEQERVAIEIAFGNAGLNDWDPDGRRIKVPRESRSQYLAALENSTALPISLRTSVQEAIDKASVFEPNELRLAREMHAKERDLGAKISRFPDVQWASVEYDRGDRRGLSQDRVQSASVVVVPEINQSLGRDRIKQIQDLVRSSYAGMASEDVVVIDTNSSSYGMSDDVDPMLKKQKEAEFQIEQKIRSLLIEYPVRIAVSAEIDPTMDVKKTVLTYDPEPTNLASRQRKVETSSNKPISGGVPGAVPNATGTLAANRAVSLEENAEVTKSNIDERESSGVAGQQYEDSRTASLQVKRVRVSVGLPESYYQTVYEQEFLRSNPDSNLRDAPPMDATTLTRLRDDTKADIQSAINVLLPEVPAGADRFPLVEVWDYPDLPDPVMPVGDSQDLALTWLADSWQSIALIVLAMLALLVARSAAKGGSPGNVPPEFQEGFGLVLPQPPPEEEEEESEVLDMQITGMSLKDELSGLVQKNPEVAANVIRSWMQEAA